MRAFGLAFGLLLTGAPSEAGSVTPSRPDVLQVEAAPEDERFRFYMSDLFHDVQTAPVFNDSKTFPDMMPKVKLESIMDEYTQRKKKGDVDLAVFVQEYFDEPDEIAVDDGQAQQGENIKSYIRRMWPLLTRSFENAKGSLLYLPKETIVPGGRFREAYYWDSLFPFLVLLDDKEYELLAMNLLDNAAYQARLYGYIPNGNRDYYLGRSQPPILAMMINALFDKDADKAVQYLDALEIEYNFWSREDNVTESSPKGRMVVATDGNTEYRLHIYDSRYGEIPRPEAWKEDVRTMEEAVGGTPDPEAPFRYRDIKASCESGWDFTSRFTVGCSPRRCLRTTEFAPVELNAFMQHSARVLSKLHRHLGNTQKADRYDEHAEQKKEILNEYFWDEETGVFMDRFWRTGDFSDIITPASVVPLALNLTTPEKAEKTLFTVKDKLLRKGGLVSTQQKTGEQWDSPFGWAPLQYFYIIAALNYGHIPEAVDVATRWLEMVNNNFNKYGRIFEKYDVTTAEMQTHGGEYVTQAGFAFTNAITYDIIEMLQYLENLNHTKNKT
eukprot:Blabericola_migrator_1__6098@NODE_307_length_10081_cov_93_692830_g251_i0_p3_GENE_NODE_307_length_10081_cov_93_692830_g251_i0NODE_307_length_10081_cov_93_692830_g251_i0_p3_ORF_typecomplete_len554_score102_39Trehalase/PF01204_18/4_8e75GDE_C/PF06202_14/8_5e16Bac_rhamnosid6H/PF17389_2/5_7e13Glyco_hydro_36/PF17167_4/1_5e05DUF608/PF04685_13/1_1e03DUF608/PF04685_13/0_015GlcNAc_2epim/PF07221_11/0_32GlcNAc_2epim/PF07221_11/6e02_NODE_307_length_10081_cov_93_692830_g251_i075199180